MKRRALLQLATHYDSALVHRAQLDAERLVAIIRIAVSLGLFGAIVVLIWDMPANPTGFVKRQLALASLTLGAYVMLGCISLWALSKGWFRIWMIWIVVTADCMFLLTNTWFSLTNAGLPGDLLFGMPSVWLVPMVLAFAVLRFNPALQIYSVVLVVLGLGVLVWASPTYVVADPMERLVVSLQLPPNLMRLAMILVAGGVLVIAALRMRDLLRRSIEEARQKANLTRYLPEQVALDLAVQNADGLRRGHHRQAAVLFVDIRGFTQWSEGRDPQEVGDFITEFRRRVEAEARQCNGIIDKYIGDAAMLFFVDEDAAARALMCGQEILSAVSHWSGELENKGKPPVHAGVGVHFGEVFLGVVGTPERMEYTVMGDTVNVAARLQEMSKTVGQPYVASDAMLRAAQAKGRPAPHGWRPLPNVGLRGRTGAIALFGWSPGR